MSEFLLVLFLAHLLGDFYFQRGAWVAHKAIFTYRSWYAYVHPAIHTSLIYALCKLEMDYILPALCVGIIHGLIDLGKVQYSKRYNPTAMFLLDQALHLFSLVMIGRAFLYPRSAAMEPPRLLCIAGNLRFFTGDKSTGIYHSCHFNAC